MMPQLKWLHMWSNNIQQKLKIAVDMHIDNFIIVYRTSSIKCTNKIISTTTLISMKQKQILFNRGVVLETKIIYSKHYLKLNVEKLWSIVSVTDMSYWFILHPLTNGCQESLGKDA